NTWFFSLWSSVSSVAHLPRPGSRQRLRRFSRRRETKLSYSSARRRRFGSQRRPFSLLQRAWAPARLSSALVPARPRARLVSSGAPSPVLASKAIGPLQIRHLPTQSAPRREKIESVSATRAIASAVVIGRRASGSGRPGAGQGGADHQVLADIL